MAKHLSIKEMLRRRDLLVAALDSLHDYEKTCTMRKVVIIKPPPPNVFSVAEFGLKSTVGGVGEVFNVIVWADTHCTVHHKGRVYSIPKECVKKLEREP